MLAAAFAKALEPHDKYDRPFGRPRGEASVDSEPLEPTYTPAFQKWRLELTPIMNEFLLI